MAFVSAQILAITGVCLAYGEDDPYTYSKISAVKESQIQVISGDLYSSGKVVRPTSVFFPTLLIKNVGFPNQKGGITKRKRTIRIFIPGTATIR